MLRLCAGVAPELHAELLAGTDTAARLAALEPLLVNDGVERLAAQASVRAVLGEDAA